VAATIAVPGACAEKCAKAQGKEKEERQCSHNKRLPMVAVLSFAFEVAPRATIQRPVFLVAFRAA